MKDIIVAEKRSKAFRLAGMGLLMFAVSAAILVFGILEAGYIYSIIGIAATLFFGMSFLFALLRALRLKPLLTISENGITDSSSLSAVGYITYEDIAEVRIVSIFGQRVIGITPKNVEGFVNKLQGSKQKAALMNIKMNYPPVAIRVDTAADMSIEVIYAIIKKCIEEKDKTL